MLGSPLQQYQETTARKNTLETNCISLQTCDYLTALVSTCINMNWNSIFRRDITQATRSRPVLRTPRCSRCLFTFTVQPAEASQWICKVWQIALLMVFTCSCLVCWLMTLAEPPSDSAVLLLVQPRSCRGVGHWPENSSRQETELCLL